MFGHFVIISRFFRLFSLLEMISWQEWSSFVQISLFLVAFNIFRKNFRSRKMKCFQEFAENRLIPIKTLFSSVLRYETITVLCLKSMFAFIFMFPFTLILRFHLAIILNKKPSKFQSNVQHFSWIHSNYNNNETQIDSCWWFSDVFFFFQLPYVIHVVHLKHSSQYHTMWKKESIQL